MSEGTIITFYSYKGGVGRTFALANIATLLAKWGHRVLCVDWDLEAPGLHLYFEDRLVQREPKGLVDLFEDWSDGATRKSLHWQSFVTRVDVPDTAGELGLICAGSETNYVQRMQALNWTTLYDKHRLGPAIEQMRNEWRARYDFILIDSRTGVSDIGGICTVQLPDQIVLLASPNRQSLDGLYRVAEAAQAAAERMPVERARLLFIPVITRFEARTERLLAREWLERFARTFEPLCQGWLHYRTSISDLLEHTQIPHVAYWSFGEKLAVLEEGIDNPEGIGHAFATLAALLGNRLVDSVDLVENRDAYLRKAQHARNVERQYTHDVFISHARGGLSVARALARDLESKGFRVWLDDERAVGALADRVNKAIAASRHFVVVVDPSGSTWQRREIEAILRAKATRTEACRVVPFIMLNAKTALPIELAEYSRVEQGDELGDALNRVTAELTASEAATPSDQAAG